MATHPRPLSYVKFIDPHLGAAGKEIKVYPFKKNAVYLFLGEIPNMPGHCVVVENSKGKIYSGYHTEIFSELLPEEI